MLKKSVCDYLARAISFFENLGVICSDPVTLDLICLVLIELKYTGKWGNDKRSFFQNPAREILSAPRAFLALMFLNKRVMPENSNFREGTVYDHNSALTWDVKLVD